MHPVAGSQLSAVHAFPSSQLSGVPAVHVPAWQVSSPLQTLPSEHDVPLATGVWMHPVAGSQLSAVHAFPWSQLSGVPWHAPEPVQASPPVQAFPSLHAAPTLAVCTQPLTGSQVSVVQVFVSLQLTGDPWHAPEPVQASPAVQALPSLQGVPGGAEDPPTQSPDPSQVSLTEQGLPLSQATPAGAAGPLRQIPLPLQASLRVHGSPSSHDVPLDADDPPMQAPAPSHRS